MCVCVCKCLCVYWGSLAHLVLEEYGRMMKNVYSVFKCIQEPSQDISRIGTPALPLSLFPFLWPLISEL